MARDGRRQMIVDLARERDAVGAGHADRRPGPAIESTWTVIPASSIDLSRRSPISGRSSMGLRAPGERFRGRKPRRAMMTLGRCAWPTPGLKSVPQVQRYAWAYFLQSGAGLLHHCRRSASAACGPLPCYGALMARIIVNCRCMIRPAMPGEGARAMIRAGNRRTWALGPLAGQRPSRAKATTCVSCLPQRGRVQMPRSSAATAGSRWSSSYDEILSAPDIDAVVLATPHSQHQAQALAAIAANKHVFVEKPLTLDLAARCRRRRRAQSGFGARGRFDAAISSEHRRTARPAA